MGAADLDPSSLERVAGWLLAARRVLVITGAGVSADSGLPTYRGIGGLYEDSATEDGMPIEEALSGPMLRRRPELTWRHIAAVERACRGARPNRAHQVLAALEQRLPALWVLTQNVDGLHRAAGTRKLIEIHGTVHDLVCTGCGARRRVPDFDGLKHVLAIDRLAPVAPGVVAIATPGHTPGHLLFYVRTADGREILYVGDLAWSFRNLEVARSRPRAIAEYFLHEDAPAVADQLRALITFAELNPEVTILVSHDAEHLERQIDLGVVEEGLR